MSRKLTSSPFTRRIDRGVLAFVRERECLSAGETVVAAVSGGPDSTALLLILSRIAKELSIGVKVAHFDHMLRSRSEADGDRRFVRDLCKTLRLPLATGQGNAGTRARRQKESVEDAARKVRYRFLGREARKEEATAVVTGHTLDDRAETVLLHILRGSGIAGLVGMRARSPWPFGRGPEIARPILGLRREETERYCRDCGVEPRRDPTNDLPIATRNRVRNELMPALRDFNPRATEALSRLAEAAAVDDDFIDRVADRDWTALASATRARVVFPRDAFAGFHPAVQARLLMRAADRLGGEATITAGHIADIATALAKQRTRVSLPGGLSCTITPGRMTITKTTGRKEKPPPETTLPVPGSVTWGGWTLKAEPVKGPLPKRIGAREAYIAASAIKGKLSVRARRPGDRMRPLGLRGTKKLQDIFVDSGVPAEERDSVPILCDKEGVLWVVGQRLAERAAVRKTGAMVHVSAGRKRGGQRVDAARTGVL